MITLRQLYTQFGHDPKWTRLATASTQPMVAVYLRKLGDKDITLLTEFDIKLQEALCQQPDERKVKARSCLHHLLNWAKEQGKKVITIAAPGTKQETTKDDRTETRQQVEDVHTDDNRQRRVSQTAKPHNATTRKAKPVDTKRTEPVDTKRTEPKPKPRTTARRKSDKKLKPKVIITLQPKPERKHKQADELDREKWMEDTRPRRGTIYHDTASKGDIRAGSRRMKDCYRAEITIQGIRYRYRAETRQECAEWLKAVTSKKILPTDNKADWWRMEQHKDEAVRIDEIIVNQAEESVMLYDYHQTHDLTAISRYVEQRLLPHMVYYCCHTLSLSQRRTQTASKQAIALLLTRIIAGRPVANFTNSCKRMLRTYRDRGDFFYYETKAPREVQLMVNRIDMSALAELYKVTKDRRI